MRFFCLMQVESSLFGSVRIDSLRMSRSSSDDGSFFTNKSLIIIGAFTFLSFFQSRLTRVDFYFSLRVMMLKILFVDFFETSVAVWLRNYMRRCVGCTAFARICVRLCAM